MRHAISLLSISIAFAVLAAIHRGFYWVLMWPAFSFAAVAAAYFRLGPRVFSKRPSGTLPLHTVVLLFPFLAMAWLTWRVQVMLSREPCFHEIVPGLYVGRRAARCHLPPATTTIVDLTAEFPECRGIVREHAYFLLATLDGAAPSPGEVVDLVVKLRAADAIYVHCAQGHGRSAMFAAALLIARGLAPDVASVEELLRASRPGIRINRAQRAALTALLPRLRAIGSSEPSAARGPTGPEHSGQGPATSH